MSFNGGGVGYDGGRPQRPLKQPGSQIEAVSHRQDRYEKSGRAEQDDLDPRQNLGGRLNDNRLALQGYRHGDLHIQISGECGRLSQRFTSRQGDRGFPYFAVRRTDLDVRRQHNLEIDERFEGGFLVHKSRQTRRSQKVTKPIGTQDDVRPKPM